eukprot:TRINITY_DN7254_c0_g1_i1.p1 TRINITY_DN7254_c0_g1~~TRINITY_DN7254_c0_g1_i1.p1  ORF type:complete len:776 (+),score=215.85 TRINITY_DN7254_c0_g1_i1:54-2381(+)
MNMRRQTIIAACLTFCVLLLAPGFFANDTAGVATPAEGAEQFTFQAEINQLMKIIINSLYTNKEIFLREIISNASDALDKIRFQSLTDPSILGEGDQAKLEIHLSFDKDNGILYLRDTGIGMTRDDLINNLGRIAKSGTKEFLERLGKGGDVNLIGQFGVGFYSIFLVADRVRVITKNNEDKQYIWESNAESTFSITEDTENEPLGRGTKLILYLKEDAKEYLEEYKLKEIVHKYAEFITFPIYLDVERTHEEEVPVEDGEEATEEETTEEEEEESGDEEEEEEGAEEEEKKPKTKKVTTKKLESTVLNDVKPIWVRKPADITREEYNKFYQTISKDSENPLTYIHFNAEGDVDFKSLLFIPDHMPLNLFDGMGGMMHNIKLYVRRVFISDTFEDLLPRYLNFVRGVVDSDDLPINISRETLQENKLLRVIRKKLIRKAIEMVQIMAKNEQRALKEKEGKASEEEESDLADDESPSDEGVDPIQKYRTFIENFGISLKLGVIDDSTNRQRLAKLLRFKTSKSDGRFVGLEEYVSNMKPEQKFIYFISGESIESVQSSPFLEQLKKRGYEVLFMVDPIDEYLVQHLQEFDDKKLMNVAKEGLKFGDEEFQKEREKFYEEQYGAVRDYLKELLGDKVEKVTISNRVTESPAVLVTSQFGWTANMERIMKAQALADPTRGKVMTAKKILEINPTHPIIKELNKRVKEESNADSNTDLANLVYETALLQSGFNVDDLPNFAGRIHRILKMSLNIDPNAASEEDDFVPPAKSDDYEHDEL